MVRVYEDDSAAALALVERYTGPLFNLIHRTTGMAGVAVDVTREVLASAVGNLAERVPLAGRRWIVRLAADAYRRLLAMDLKAEQPAHRVRISPRHWEPDRLDLSPDARPSPRRLAQKLRQRLWRAWSLLAMRERFVLALTEMAQISLGELAEVLDETVEVARIIRDQAKLSLMGRLAAKRATWKSWLTRRRRRRRP